MTDNKAAIWVLIGLVAVMFAFQSNIGGFRDAFQSATPPPADGVPPTGDGARPFCEHDGITLTHGPVKRMFSPTTSISDEYHRLFLDGSDDGLKADGSTKALSPGDDISVIYGENSSTHYARKIDLTLPCKATISTAQIKIDRNGADITDAFRLYQQDATTTLNFKCFNEDDGLLNEGMGGTNNETLDNNEEESFDCSFKGTSDQAFSGFGRVLITAIYNTTAYEEIKLSSLEIDWSSIKADTPTFRSNNNITTGFGAVTYAFWKTGVATDGTALSGLISNEKVDFSLFVETGDETSDNPAGVGGKIHLVADDEDWYRHSDDGDMRFGAETDTDSDVGITTTVARVFNVN